MLAFTGWFARCSNIGIPVQAGRHSIPTSTSRRLFRARSQAGRSPRIGRGAFLHCLARTIADMVVQLHTLILLALGSLLPLSTYFPLPNGCHLHTIDSHRPWNLQNLFGLDLDAAEDGEGASSEGRIWVWGDGEEGQMAGVKKSWEALEVGLRDHS